MGSAEVGGSGAIAVQTTSLVSNKNEQFFPEGRHFLWLCIIVLSIFLYYRIFVLGMLSSTASVSVTSSRG